MTLLDKLERKLRPYGVPHVTIALAVLQLGTWFMCQAQPEMRGRLVLTRETLFHGEWWRLISVILMPPDTNIIFLVFGLYFFYIMGTALEREWGVVRYNLYLLIGYMAMIATVFVPGAVVGNEYWLGSVFLAFAVFYPEFVIYIFFILPVKVMWLAIAMWLIYAFMLITGDWSTRAQVAAGIFNFLLFFHRDIVQGLKSRHRRMATRMSAAAARDRYNAMHTCQTCGVTEKSNPKMEFRYCPQCKGTLCYCIEHIQDHEHRG